MAIKTSTLASIYEMQGYNEEACVIYEELIKQDPSNEEARLALARLRGGKQDFSGVNGEKLALFVRAKGSDDYRQLEQWLLS